MSNLRKFTTVNWKTTTAGAMGFLITVLVSLQAVLDGDPETVADWNDAVPALFGLVMLLIGLFSRDADKSSEDEEV